MELTRAEAWNIVNEWTQSAHLVRHMVACESAMRAYARRFGENEELWGVVGLIHDFDYERYPDLSVEGHPVVGVKYLQTQGVPEVITRAILSHASEYTGIYPESLMEKSLVAVDELTGFIVAAALVRPSKKVADVQLSSIKKRWKEKSFAAGVHREEIEKAAVALGVLLDDHIQVVLDAMKANAEVLGL